MRFLPSAVVCVLLIAGSFENASGASQETQARRRRLKALAEKEKTASDPRGAERQRLRRLSQHRNLREGVAIKADYYERRKHVQVKGSVPMTRKEEKEEDLAFWHRILQNDNGSFTTPPTGAPVAATTSPPSKAPVDGPAPTDAPATSAPTQAPVADDTSAPTQAPATSVPTKAPTLTSNPTSGPTTSPVETGAPTTSPVVPQTPLPTLAPVAPATDLPTLGPVTPVPTNIPTASPIAATPQPTACTVSEIILPVALFGGAEFTDPNSYQSQALDWLCSSATTGLSDDRIIQRYALASIYYATFNVSTAFTDIAFGPGIVFPWANSNGWITDANECDWFRIDCDTGNAVTFINLFSNLVTGEFPPEVVYMKGTLQILDVGTNQVFTDGTIFNSYLGELTELTDLRYDDTNFQNNPGVPIELGNLKNLGFYNAARTLYRGPLNGASFPSDMLDLYWIELEYNGFNSSIPLSIGQLPNLTNFFIRDSFIDGSLEYMRTMPLIRTNWVDNNPGLAGPLPTFLGDLATLGSFSVTDCSFTGTLPTELGQLGTVLTFAFFFLNGFTGGIPPEWSSLNGLEVLQVQDNLLTETIPAQVCALRFSGLNILEADCEICPPNSGAIPCCSSCI